MNTLQTRS